MSDERYTKALRALLERSKRIARANDERFVRLTRCDWSARKRRSVDRFTTLYQWVDQMRKTAPQAWEQATALGVCMDGRSVRFRGRPATGARLVKPMSELLEHPSVRAFEHASAAAALRRFEAVGLSPGRWGRHLMGCGLHHGEVRYGRVRIQLEAPPDSATIGQAFETSDSFAQAAAQALEHPDILVAAAWRASSAGRGARPRAKDLLAIIAAKVRSGITTRTLRYKETAYRTEELLPLGLSEPLEALQRLIWPLPQEVDVARVLHDVSGLAALRRSPLRPRTAWSLVEP